MSEPIPCAALCPECYHASVFDGACQRCEPVKCGFVEQDGETPMCGQCKECKEEEAYWRQSYETEGRAHYAARESLGLQRDASESDVMAAARALK